MTTNRSRVVCSSCYFDRGEVRRWYRGVVDGGCCDDCGAPVNRTAGDHRIVCMAPLQAGAGRYVDLVLRGAAIELGDIRAVVREDMTIGEAIELAMRVWELPHPSDLPDVEIRDEHGQRIDPSCLAGSLETRTLSLAWGERVGDPRAFAIPMSAGAARDVVFCPRHGCLHAVEPGEIPCSPDGWKVVAPAHAAAGVGSASMGTSAP